MAKGKEEKLCVVLTEFKEIFCGWTSDYDGDVVNLRDARQAVYFSSDTHGLLGLATNGPAKGSRVGPAANIQCRRVVNIIECSVAAQKVWSEAKWAN
jgi:hypothetical protein